MLATCLQMHVSESMPYLGQNGLLSVSAFRIWNLIQCLKFIVRCISDLLDCHADLRSIAAGFSWDGIQLRCPDQSFIYASVVFIDSPNAVASEVSDELY